MTNEIIVPAAPETGRRKTIRRSTAINEARLGVLLNWLRQRGEFWLTDETYRNFRFQGFSRGELHRIIGLMAERDIAVVEARNCTVVVRLVEEPGR